MLNSLLIIAAYLSGSVPTGLLLARLEGVDIRRDGSGNIGATNVARLTGKKLGALTLLGDALKAVVPMVLAAWLLRTAADRDLWVALCGGAALLGHMFPVFLKFRGGKGVATALGVFLVLEPLAVLISVLLFGGLVCWRGYVSVGSLTVSAMMPLWIWLLDGSGLHVALAVGIAMMIWLKHLDNISRLMHGEEKSWKRQGGDERG